MKHLSIFLIFVVAPTQVLAFDFGFVRVPNYLDVPIVCSAILTAIFAFILKRTLPAKLSFKDVPQQDRTKLMAASAYLSLTFLLVTLALLFIGMGLQRAVE